jgi:hypothetical protein
MIFAIRQVNLNIIHTRVYTGVVKIIEPPMPHGRESVSHL